MKYDVYDAKTGILLRGELLESELSEACAMHYDDLVPFVQAYGFCDTGDKLVVRVGTEYTQPVRFVSRETPRARTRAPDAFPDESAG